MWAGSWDVDCGAGGEGEEVHCEQSDEVAGVGGGVLGLQAGEEVEDVGEFRGVFFLGGGLQGGLDVADGGVGCFEDVGDEGADCGVGELWGGGGEELVERGEGGEEGLDFRGGFPAGEDFEGAEGDGDFGFVVRVGELVWVFGVEFFGEGFVGVDLEGEGFCDGEDFGEEGDYAAEFRDAGLA